MKEVTLNLQYLKTELQKGKPKEVENKRIKRISEALNWEAGSKDSPLKHVVTELPNGMEVYFLKPGKEAFEKEPNPNDMTPCVGPAGEPYGFDTVWKQLSKVSVHNFEVFKAVLILIYRNAYLLDHVEEKKGIIRYKPCKKIADCIKELERTIGALMDYGLLGFLHFMDILGWNEDVKYHIENGEPTFMGNRGWMVGRVNTLLSCIKIPYKTYKVVEDIREHSLKPQEIDWSLVYETMQILSRQGVCPARQYELLEWFYPYIVKNSSQQKIL